MQRWKKCLQCEFRIVKEILWLLVILCEWNCKPFPSEKIMKKNLSEWCSINYYFKKRCFLFNVTKLKMLGKKTSLFDKNVSKETLLELLEDCCKNKRTEINNENLLRNYFTFEFTSCVFKISCLKRRPAGAQESKHFKLCHWLETDIVSNLMKDSRDKISLYKIHGVLEDRLVQKLNKYPKKVQCKLALISW